MAFRERIVTPNWQSGTTGRYNHDTSRFSMCPRGVISKGADDVGSHWLATRCRYDMGQCFPHYAVLRAAERERA